MRGKVRDVAAEIGVKPLFRLGMEIVRKLTERCNRCGDEIAARHEGAVELAAFLIEPVAADYRDIAARDVARTDFDDDRRPLLNPAPPFGLRLRAADIEQHAHGFAKGIERLEIGRAQSELQSLMRISYAVFCLKKKTKNTHLRVHICSPIQ